MSVRIEEVAAAVADDVRDGVVALEVATEQRPLGPVSLLEEAAREDGVLLVARAQAPAPTAPTTVVGFASARLLVDEAHVVRVTVDPAWRRQGIGARLLDALVIWAARRGADAVVLEVRAGNVAAHALYDRAGFVVDGRRVRYYPDGEDALLLRRMLPRAAEMAAVTDDGGN